MADREQLPNLALPAKRRNYHALAARVLAALRAAPRTTITWRRPVKSGETEMSKSAARSRYRFQKATEVGKVRRRLKCAQRDSVLSALTLAIDQFRHRTLV